MQEKKSTMIYFNVPENFAVTGLSVLWQHFYFENIFEACKHRQYDNEGSCKYIVLVTGCREILNIIIHTYTQNVGVFISP